MPDRPSFKTFKVLKNSSFIVVTSEAQPFEADHTPKTWSALQVVHPKEAQYFVDNGFASKGFEIDTGVYQHGVTELGYNVFLDLEKHLGRTHKKNPPTTVDITPSEYDRVSRGKGGEFPRPEGPGIDRTYINFVSSGPTRIRKGCPADNAEPPTGWREGGFGTVATYGHPDPNAVRDGQRSGSHRFLLQQTEELHSASWSAASHFPVNPAIQVGPYISEPPINTHRYHPAAARFNGRQ
ncbi:hypothetical protein AB0H69_48425 [Streptomyces phaeochromogenes]|uniref:hypothetical protein n=1 Tax=Streptomyces phaeochromogenes TaxID=1923 RepID=UPI0033DD7BD3